MSQPLPDPIYADCQSVKTPPAALKQACQNLTKSLQEKFQNHTVVNLLKEHTNAAEKRGLYVLLVLSEESKHKVSGQLFWGKTMKPFGGNMRSGPITTSFVADQTIQKIGYATLIRGLLKVTEISEA